MHTVLASYWRFLLAGLTEHGQTGAIVPSQGFLIRQMISPIPANYDGHVVELGAGTGSLTLRLAQRCHRARITACEINKDLWLHTRGRVESAGLERRVRVVPDSAEHLLVNLAKRPADRPDFVVSGIPLGNLDADQVRALLGFIRSALRPGGMYIQFQYSLLDRKKIKGMFARLRTVPVLLNFPPAFVYYAQA